MSERNNIDRLFQEKFKDFEVMPSDKVWENIQSKMNTKEKKTNFLPFWLRLCSFAAVFLIGFSVATTFIAAPFGLKNPFVDSKEKNSNTEKTTVSGNTTEKDNTITTNSFGNTNNENNTGVTTPSANSILNSKEHRSTGNNDTEKTLVSSSKENHNALISAPKTGNRISISNKVKSDKKKQHQSKITNQNDYAVTLRFSKGKMGSAVSKNENSALNPSNSEESNATISKRNNQSEIVATVSKSEDGITANHDFTSDEEIQIAEDFKNVNSETQFDYNLSNSKVAYESGNKHVPSTSKKENKSTIATPDTSKAIADKNTSSSSVANKNKVTENKTNAAKALSVVTDSLADKEKEVAEKTDEKKTAEEKDSKEKREKKSNWIVSSSFSPVYMNLNGTGSTLDSKFAENSKSYQTSMSYGVGLQYALNNKWTVRTGINALNFEYNTNNIVFYYSSSNTGLENVNENSTGTGIVIENPNAKDIAYNGEEVVTTRYKGNINHRINYIEVPLELSYKIVNKKFGVDVIGGVSSIFLNDNRVSLISSESNLNIGEANNLNKLHFSTNLGLGLRYNFMKNLQVNMEPMFKYQINTYNGNAGNFKPYFIGVYSGISFSF